MKQIAKMGYLVYAYIVYGCKHAYYRMLRDFYRGYYGTDDQDNSDSHRIERY